MRARAVHQVRLQDAMAQPWRNGGGTTRELLVWRSQPWTLRVSVADIERDGPFSAYPGVHRAFTVLEGAGVELSWAGTAQLLLAGDAPCHFDGAQAPGCRLLDGPTRDLNLMVLATAGRACMHRAEVGSLWPAGTLWRGLYVHGAARANFGSGEVEVPPATLCWSDDSDERQQSNGRKSSDESAAAWQLRSGGPAWWLALQTPAQ